MILYYVYPGYQFRKHKCSNYSLLIMGSRSLNYYFVIIICPIGSLIVMFVVFITKKLIAKTELKKCFNNAFGVPVHMNGIQYNCSCLFLLFWFSLSCNVINLGPKVSLV